MQKSVIEWVENPFTDKRETIEIKIGEVFHRKCQYIAEIMENILMLILL